MVCFKMARQCERKTDQITVDKQAWSICSVLGKKTGEGNNYIMMH